MNLTYRNVQYHVESCRGFIHYICYRYMLPVVLFRGPRGADNLCPIIVEGRIRFATRPTTMLERQLDT